MDDEIKEVVIVNSIEDNPKKINGEQGRQIVFLILILIAIIALVAATITVHRYAEILTNPLGYNLAQFKLQSCTCIDNFGKFVDIVATNKTGGS